jgi:hypothetical protein
LLEVGERDSIFHVQDFNAHHLVVFAEVKHDARTDLFRLDDLGVIQAEIDRIGFLIEM